MNVCFVPVVCLSECIQHLCNILLIPRIYRGVLVTYSSSGFKSKRKKKRTVECALSCC